ncbi:MAG: cytochrome c biogenesis protein CcdA, partial [Candidatus Subteraquimicrobiales bacterium]|nr:cytochrome c biogenesis protein CcdA [Candidatus Subteraquimicrobiales bacterium]
LATPSFFSYLAVFILGIFVSLGSCAIMELPLLMGYIGGVETHSRKRIFILTVCFILGMLTTYFAIGLIIGLASLSLGQFARGSSMLFYVIAFVSFVFGLYLLGFLHLSFPRTKFLSRVKKGKGDFLGAYLIGLIFIFFEAPTCPSCAPALILISSYMVTKGTILAGVTLLMTYVLGQSVPVLIAGSAVGWLKQLTHRFTRWEEYLQIASGIFLIVIALDLLWLA